MLDELGRQRNITARCAHFGLIPDMVASSLLVLTTSRQYCERFTARLPLKILDMLGRAAAAHVLPAQGHERTALVELGALAARMHQGRGGLAGGHPARARAPNRRPGRLASAGLPAPIDLNEARRGRRAGGTHRNDF